MIMTCNEAQTLEGPYLDSELDAKTALGIQQHLESCPQCANRFTEQQKLDAQIKARLNRGKRNEALWERIERSMATAAVATQLARRSARASSTVGWRSLVSAFEQHVQASWRRSRWAWSGLAAIWAAILALNFTEREPQAKLAAPQKAPSVSEMRFARRQRERLMVELVVPSETASVDRPRPASPRPRSDKRNETSNA
jgi:anti-sigma factor RsiW